MAKNLVIVESPAKAKTINKFIGKDYIVKASVGHVRDLPKSELGVDEETFEPTYEVLEGKEKVAKVNHLLLAKYDDHNYGYLRVHVDKDYLKIGFHQVGVRSLAQSRFDMVTVRLADHHMVAN